MKKISITLALATTMALSIVGCSGGGDRPSAAVAVVQPSDDFQQGMLATQELMIGAQGDRGQAMYQKFFTDIHAKAKDYADAITFDHPNQLWLDLPQFPDSKAVMYSGIRLKIMSQAYITPGPMYLNAELLQKIRQGLDAFVTRYYHQGVAITAWYEYQISAPQELMMIITNLDSYLSSELKEKIIAATRNYLPSIDVNLTVTYSPQTSANRVDLAWAMLVRGFVSKNAIDIEAAKQAFFDSKNDMYAAQTNARPYSSGAFRTSSVDGFRGDGSYVFHGDLPYAAGYGLDLINRSTEMLMLLKDTAFDFSTAEKDVILNDAFNQLSGAWLPWLRDGLGMDAVAGRAVFRGFEQDHGKGHWGMEGLLKFYRLADFGSDPAVNQQRKALVGKFIKSFITNEQNYYAKYGGNDDAVAKHDYHNYATRALSIATATAIMGDGSIPYVKEALPGTFVNPESDRFLHRRDGFSFAISGHSYRTGNFEIVAGEGTRHCYAADGMTYLHDDDLDQYMDYWVAFDANRPAGVTNDASAPANPLNCAWSALSSYSHKTDLRWSGGVAAGTDGIGAFGMGYRDWHWTTAAGSTTRIQSPFVEAKKSWFAFGDVILAMGSDIKCNAGCDRTKLATTLDNRKLNGTASNIVTVNGGAWQGQASVADVKTVHISGNSDTSMLGIVLPTARSVGFVKESLTGDWLTLADRASFLMKGTLVKGSFLQTALSHAAASDNSYAYVLLPGKTSAATTAYAANPTVKILASTAELHAASDQTSGAFAMNVFAAPSAAYTTASATLMLNRFKAAGNINLSLTGAEAGQLLTAAAKEPLYGVAGQVQSSGGSSVMTRLTGDEMTVWISQPLRNVMSAVLDFSAAGFKIASVVEGGAQVNVSDDGGRALVRPDLDFIGGVWEARGVTYKLRFKVKR
jgi:hyaluronate lyase